MRNGRAASVHLVACLASLLSAAAPAFARDDQDDKGRSLRDESARSASASKKERVAGVLVKVERVARNGEKGRGEKQNRPGTFRLTINMNAVWRDWARDQARVKDEGPARKDAKEGENSVATKGEPEDRNALVVVDVVPESKIETRFRAADEEEDKGSKQSGTSRTQQQGGSRSSSAKPVRFRPEDLKPGLFVEVDFRHVTGRNPASTVAVIRPIGGPNAPADAGATKGSNPSK